MGSLRRWSVATLLVGSLAAGTAPAWAEGPNPPGSQEKPAHGRIGHVPYRLVKLMPETRQALLYDRDRNAHVLVAEGDRVGDFDVVEIDDDQLVLSRNGREVMLVVDAAAPAPSATLPPQIAPPPPTSAHPVTGGTLEPYGPDAAAPVVPVAPVPAAAPATPALSPLLDPYGENDVREVLAPPAQRAGGDSTDVVDPYAGAVQPKVVTAPAAARPIPPTPAPGSASAPDAIRAGTLDIKRADLEGAIGDFDKLGHAIGFTRTDRGVRLGTIDRTSYFWQLGLRSGDVVTAIDGAAVHDLDDAAMAYARLGSAKKLSLDVERGAARGTLKFALH